MSGVLSVLSAPSVERVTVTLEDLTPGYGQSISVSLRGNTGFFIRHRPDNSTLFLNIASQGVPQSFFRRIRIEGANAGQFQTYTSASATFVDAGLGISQWTWTEPTLWSAADIGELKKIELYL